MAFATRDQYDLALRDPATALRKTHSRALRHGRVLGVMNAPSLASRAVLYKFETADHQLKTLRCFLPEAPDDMAARYERMRRFFNGRGDLAAVTARYHVYPTGITVRRADEEPCGRPLVVMDWIDGQTLVQYVDWACSLVDRRRSGLVLDRLIGRYVTLLTAFANRGAALGDLAGNNLIVSADGHVVAIDYDFAFVPNLSLADDLAWQAGYRRPDLRLPVDNEQRDVFSGLVIYTALLALRNRPELWGVYTHRDGLDSAASQTLLFSDHDLADPEGSELFRELARIPDPELSRALGMLRTGCLSAEATLRPAHELAGWQPPGGNDDGAPCQAVLDGDRLVVWWSPAAARQLPPAHVSLAWRADAHPNQLPEQGSGSYPLSTPECRGTLTIAHGLAGPPPMLYVRLFALAREPDTIVWKADPDQSPLWEGQARQRCTVTCRLIERPTRSANSLVASTIDGSPLPLLKIVRRAGGIPVADEGYPLVGYLGGTGRSHDYLVFSVAGFPPDTYLGVFPQYPADRAWIEVVGEDGAGLRFQVTRSGRPRQPARW